MDDLILEKSYWVLGATGRIYIGRLVAVSGPRDITLADAVWVSDEGRSSALMRGQHDDNFECEVVGTVTLCPVLEYRPWPHPLFTRNYPA